ncbi:MAG: nuclear transport factor 2 family protein [Acidimicrobiales bacterium]
MSADELSELAARVRRLEDREELRALVARYGRSVDDRDWESLAGQYTPDAVFDSAMGRSVGTDAIVEYYKARTDAYVASYHYPHSHEITFVDDDVATGLVCAHAELTIEGDTVWVALRYHDDYRRVDGKWLFHERKTRILYVLKLSEMDKGFADTLRIRWPGTEPAPAQVGADVGDGRTPEPRF